MCSPCQCEAEQVCDQETGRCGPKPECEVNDNCDAGQVCAQGACRGCVDTAECADGLICLGDPGSCVAPECTSDEQCDALAESCIDFKCAPRPCNEQLFELNDGMNYTEVKLAGDFTQWEANAIPMSPRPGGGWYVRLSVENGTYQYKFITYPAGGGDPIWITDPNNPDVEVDDTGNRNSVLSISCEAGPTNFGRCGDPSVFDWRDAIMYFVMVDRFYDSDGQRSAVPGATDGDADTGPSGDYEGGDIAGVTAKLEYLQNLGVNAIWLSAPYDNRDTAGAAIDPNSDGNMYSGYHGYWPTPANIDYSDPDNPSPMPQVESKIGTANDLRQLVDGAHGSDMKVLFDYVMNHVDVESELYRSHPEWFARGDGQNGRPNDGFALCGPLNLWDDIFWGTRCAFTDYLPPFDFDNAGARAWSVADAIWWAKEFNIDGYRLDAIKHVADSWLTDLRDALDAAFPEPAGGRFYLVGETFAYDDMELLKRYVDPVEKLDGQFDFPMKKRLCEGVFQGHMDWFAGWMDNENRGFYGADSLMTTWIGNHDIPRAIHFASGELGSCTEGSNPGNGWDWRPPQPQDTRPYELLGLAFGVLMTNPGIPLIYYGDEIGLAGGGDPDNRRMMPWNDDQLLPAQIALRSRLSQFAQLRQKYKALSRGRRTSLFSDGSRWLYKMSCGNAEYTDITVVLNRSDQALAAQGLPPRQYINVETDEVVDGAQLMIPPRSMILLRSAD